LTPGTTQAGSDVNSPTPSPTVSPPVHPGQNAGNIPGQVTGNATSPASVQPNAAAGPGDTTTSQPEDVAKEHTEDLLVAKAPQSASPASPSPSPGTDAGQTTTGNKEQAPASSSPSTPSSAGQTAAGSTSQSDGGSASGDYTLKPEGKETGQYLFDPQQSGSNVVFVLDRSYSMMGQKSRVARRELLRTLHRLGPNTSFYILLFPYLAMPAPGPLVATDENINSMGGWLYSVGHRLGSDPVPAMTKALQFNPNTVWLLSDGKFSPEAVRSIRSANDLAKVRINTIGFYSREGESVLRQIADENNGAYRFVPPPDRTRTNSAAF